jgi:hypothetical protein
MVGTTGWVPGLKVLRKMRGKCGAYLIEGDNGSAYVVKLSNNTQGGRRLLVNEFIGSVLLDQLAIATPTRMFIRIDNHCIGNDGSLPAGVHFGSLYPGNPHTTAVWDLLPSSLLPKVSNRHHFAGAMMVDEWTANADSRQAIFFRQPGTETTERRWVAQMIDNGCMFGGRDWVLPNVTTRVGRVAPRGPDVTVRDYEPWLNALGKLDPEVLNGALSELPGSWLVPGDKPLLEGLLAQLWERRRRLPAIMERAPVAFETTPQHSAQSAEAHSRKNLQSVEGQCLVEYACA